MARDYSLDELAAAVGMTTRNLRAYRAKGLLAPPRMKGRVGRYGSDHLSQVRLVQALVQRGLSLTVIAQLVERGAAASELTRLVESELADGPPSPLPLASTIVEDIEKQRPGRIREMAAAGAGIVVDGQPRTDPAIMALANTLVASGMSIGDATDVILASALAGQRVGADLGGRTARTQERAGRATPDLTATIVELATASFRRALSSALQAQVSEPGR